MCRRAYCCIAKLITVWLAWMSLSIPVKCAVCPALNYTETSCISREKAANSIIHKGCRNSLDSPYIFLYLADFQCLYDNLQRLHDTLISTQVSEFCDQLLRAYVCNYVYPGCDLDNNAPIGICQDDCMTYLLGDRCVAEIMFLMNLAGTFEDFQIPLQCTNTLLHVERAGLNLSNANTTDKCLNISGLLNEMEETTFEDNMAMNEEEGVQILAVVLPVGVGSSLIILTVCLLISGVLYTRMKKSKKRIDNSVSTNRNLMTESNHYHQKCHQYEEVALFQLTLEDVVENSNLKDAILPFNLLEILEEIGQGAFGCVFKGTYTQQQDSGTEEAIEVAIKTIKYNTGSYSELKGFIEESTIMYTFNHPNVLGLVGICFDQNVSPYLLLPYMDNGDLKNFLINRREKYNSFIDSTQKLNYKMLLRMCREIACGMEYIASKKLVHRDLAARNCMVDRDFKVRVADFGLTRDIYQTGYYRQHQNSRIPVKWMSPESLNDRISNEKTDVWSYGITCWEVFSLGRTPYPTISNADILEYLEQGYRLKQPTLCSQEMYTLMMKCWEECPKERPDFSVITYTISANILPESPSDDHQDISEEDKDNLITKLFCNSQEDSLFNSILNMLPFDYQSNFTTELRRNSIPLSATSSDQQMSDYYIEMNPLAISEEMPKLWMKSEKNAYASDQYHIYVNTPELDLRPSEVHVRQASNTSDYLLMNPAEPAR